MTEEIKYFSLKLDNDFQYAYLLDRLERIISSKGLKIDDYEARLKWRDIVDALIRSEPKQRKHGNRMELYDKYTIIKKEKFDKIEEMFYFLSQNIDMLTKEGLNEYIRTAIKKIELIKNDQT